MSAATVRIGAVELGAGRPKVCVPLTGPSLRELQVEAAAISREVADLVELRIDRFAEPHSLLAVQDAVDLLRVALPPGVPVLVTFRTTAEGGGADLEPEAYRDLLVAAAAHDGVDAVDVQMALPEQVVRAVVDGVHGEGKPAVMSFHDFRSTPSREQILQRLVRQEALGADLVKLACMPASPEDVLTLLGATADYASRPDARPAITMAMGPLGVVSRLAGETFGSALTFGTVGAASAPGQVDAGALRTALEVIHAAQPT
jgi:3-dehydroquinate dehydratase-1